MLRVKFHWFGPFYLIAQVDNHSKQTLEFTYEDENGQVKDRSSIQCIHTAVRNISVARARDYRNKAIQLDDVVDATSLESATQIRLEPEESFKAFKSWAAGIAEMDLDALLIQSRIEELARFSYPIAQPLLKFVAKHDQEALYMFIDYVARYCRINNQFHRGSMTANLTMLEPLLTEMPNDKKVGVLGYMVDSGFPFCMLLDLYPKCREFLFVVFTRRHDEADCEFDLDSLPKDNLEIIAAHPAAVRLNGYYYFFTSVDVKIRAAAASNREASCFDNYEILFHDSNSNVRAAVAGNPKAPKFKEYAVLCKDVSTAVRKAVAGNLNAPKFKEYAVLFEDDSQVVREAAAQNENAPMLKEYRVLFSDLDWRVRRAVVKNKKARSFEDYRELIPPECGDSKFEAASNPKSTDYIEYKLFFTDPDWGIRGAVSENLHAKKFDEYNMLIPPEIRKIDEEKLREIKKENNKLTKKFIFSDPRVLEVLASKPAAANYDEFRLFFEHDFSSIRASAARNKKASRFREYRQLFEDRSKNVRLALCESEEAAKFDDFALLLRDPDWDIRRAAVKNPRAVRFDEYGNLFPPEFGDDLNEILQRPDAVMYSEYGRFIKHNDWRIRSLTAANPEAPNLSEYKKLFYDYNFYVRRAVASNPKALSFNSYKTLFQNSDVNVRAAVAGNPKAPKFDEYAVLCKDAYPAVREAVAGNLNAPKFKEYRVLFTDRDWKVRTAVAKNTNAKKFEDYNVLIPPKIRRIDEETLREIKRRNVRFKRKFTLSDPQVLKVVASKPEAADYDEFRFFFKHDFWYVRVAAAQNKKATRFPEYRKLFTDDSKNVRLTLCESEEAAKFDEFALLLRDPDWDVRRAAVRNPRAVRFDEYGNLFPPEFGHDATEILQRPDAVSYSEYKRFFQHQSRELRCLAAANPEAAKLDDYKKLFNDSDHSVRKAVAANPEAPKLDRYEDLLADADWSVRSAAAANPEAPKLDKYEALLSDDDPYVRESVAANPNAVEIEKFSILFSDGHDRVISALICNPRISERESTIELLITKMRRSSSKSTDWWRVAELSHLLKKKEGIFCSEFIIWSYCIDRKYPEVLEYLKKIDLSEINELSGEHIDQHFTKKTPDPLDWVRMKPVEDFARFNKDLPTVKNTYGLCREASVEPSDMRMYLTPKVCWTPPHIIKKIPKRRGGVRTLTIPYASRKRIQKWILDNILIHVKPHDCAHGFIPGRSIATNAKPHVNRRLIIKIDLEDFFPSIKQWRVAEIFRSIGYSEKFSLVLSHLCTVCKFHKRFKPRSSDDPDASEFLYMPTSYRFLPQGGPASPYLSNLAFYRADIDIKTVCDTFGVTYTRYADDLTFSTDRQQFPIKKFIRKVFGIIFKHHFRVNKKKTKVLRPHMQQRVCGIVVNESVHVPRKYHNRIRGMLHRAENYDFDTSEEMNDYRMKLKGMIAFVNGVQPEKADRYISRFQKIDWKTNAVGG